MASNDDWRTLTEFILPGEPGSEPLAEGLLTAAMQTLSCPATLLQQLKLTLNKAIRNVRERHHAADSSRPQLFIRVLVPAGEGTAQEGGGAGNEPGQRRVVDRPVARGWGFFLVQKRGAGLQTSAGSEYRHYRE